MSEDRPPAKPDIPETPFSQASSSQTGFGQQRASSNRFSSRDSDRWSRQPPILEDQVTQQHEQEQHQQEAGRPLQNFSSRDSDRHRDPGSRSQLGSKESVRTGEFPSKASTRASSAGSRCPFLPCHSCVETCLETQDAQQHYRPSWVSCPTHHLLAAESFLSVMCAINLPCALLGPSLGSPCQAMRPSIQACRWEILDASCRPG